MNDFKCERGKGRLFFKNCFYKLHRNYLGLKETKPVNILFYPQWPSWKSGIHKTLMNLDIGITNDFSAPFVKAFFWEDKTFRHTRAKLKSLNDAAGVINYYCTDISKEKIEDVFADVFGYELRVDPLIASQMVRKSNFNSMHDGTILHGPVFRESGFVYEKLLNNEVGNGLHQDIRITYFRGIIPFVSYRYHTRDDRFGKVIRATVEDVEACLSAKEIHLINEFCTGLGFEYGDLDLIRNQNDGLLYVLDANPTPQFPPRAAISPLIEQLMINKWSGAFKKAFLQQEKRDIAVSLSSASSTPKGFFSKGIF